jgi:hypothetical protein
VTLARGGVLGALAVAWISRCWLLNRVIGASFLVGGGPMLVMAELIAAATSNWLLALTFALGVAINGAFVNLYAVAARLYPPQIRSTGVGWCAWGGAEPSSVRCWLACC